MRRRISLVLLAIGAALGLGLTLAGPATAQMVSSAATEAIPADTQDVGAAAYETDYAVNATWNDDHPKACAQNTYLTACWQPYGDVIWVNDDESNGHRVGVVWDDTEGDRAGICIDTLGVAAAATRCNKNLPEGHDIAWRLYWVTDSGEYVSEWFVTTT
jgi:hypothetical protein